MFGRRYFGGRYFGPHYFGQGSNVAPEPEPAEPNTGAAIQSQDAALKIQNAALLLVMAD